MMMLLRCQRCSNSFNNYSFISFISARAAFSSASFVDSIFCFIPASRLLPWPRRSWLHSSNFSSSLPNSPLHTQSPDRLRVSTRYELVRDENTKTTKTTRLRFLTVQSRHRNTRLKYFLRHASHTILSTICSNVPASCPHPALLKTTLVDISNGNVRLTPLRQGSSRLQNLNGKFTSYSFWSRLKILLIDPSGSFLRMINLLEFLLFVLYRRFETKPYTCFLSFDRTAVLNVDTFYINGIPFLSVLRSHHRASTQARGETKVTASFFLS